ncbi:hypothetical protein GPECTOR_20g517 [Gonium pectorale]|uniref:Uncharacterized protein n=1 Tax=Gonium pectorale TaxID=33097 RepID=A0A150GJK6_GONPE|nr:hypothetical protein GPECTOR_20g517 [Gonium pectorale]|eukprot:KXZ49660.1 hypothetical protein GPECTOR_20g517 [Gonium pectorale]
MLAGALKIMTVGWIASGAPQGCVRTVAGQYAQFLLLPVGLLMCFIAKKIVDSGLHESRRFMALVLGITAFLYFGLYSVLYRYEPKTWSAQQRLAAAAAHQRTSPYADELADGSSRRNKFIIQRQLEGEYETRTAAYYARAPEMQMQEVEAAVDGLPAGMVGGGGRGEGALGVGSTVAERRAGLAPGSRGRGAPRVVPSMYESTSRMPGLDDSEF